MFGQQTNIGGNKQVCSYYLKGTCKYGTQCWNLHPQNQAVGTMGSPFAMGANVFGAKTGTQPDSKEFTEFVKQVSGEMTQWERSGQWLFSSFTPLKSHPMLAGFSDVSPEELRMQAYDALKANTSSAYQDHWSKLQQQYKQLRDALRVPTTDAYQAMRDVFHAKGSADQQQNQSSSQALKSTAGLFGKQPLFGGSVTQSQPGAGLLGAKPQSALFGSGSLFGANQPSTTSLFGDASKTSVFGGAANLGSQNASTFGAQPNVSPFGNTGNNLFKGNTTTAGSVFGGPPKIQGNTLFGGSTATNSNAGSIFGSGSVANTPQVGGNLFGGGSSSNSTAPTTGNIFGGGSVTISTASSTGNIFGGGVSTNSTTPTTGSIFGGVPSSNTATPATPSIFGGGQNQTSNVFGTSNQNQPSTFGTSNQNQPSTFGTSNQNQSAAFGTSNQNQSATFGTSNVFGGTTATNLFGSSNNSGSSSLFGNKPSIFGGQQTQLQQQTTSTSLFGNPPASTTSIFGATPSTTSTQSQNTAAPSVFGGTGNFSMSSSGLFGAGGNNTPAQSGGGSGLFGNAPNVGQTPTGLFGNTSQTSNTAGLFGKPQESQQTLQMGTSQSGSSLFGGGSKVTAIVKAEWYTPLEQLSEEDKAQFEADDFTFIPLCPPPLELSF